MCNHFATFVMARDPMAKFKFASLQSKLGMDTLRRYGLPEDLSTVLLVEDDQVYLRSEAILRITQELNFPWTMSRILRLLPIFLRDTGYNIISSWRYTLFGYKEQCRYEPRWKDRFISENDYLGNDKTV
uniref:DUF393 domain-containing protein n=1 Tax=Arcella intermedia TaxID=1963864 RepID=A0A6B2LQL9_9EUKA